MVKLSSGKEVHPFSRVVDAEDMYEDMFQSPDWSIQFVHLFEGDMQWRA